MANWASTNYVIEGDKESLDKIYNALKNPDVQEGSSKNWEGNVLLTLKAKIQTFNVEHNEEESTVTFTGNYLRGFIQDFYYENFTIRIEAEEAWGRSDFAEVLIDTIPNIVIYWITQDDETWVTNDTKEKYFQDNYYIEAYIGEDSSYEYFQEEESALDWLSDITNAEIISFEDVNTFNRINEEDYIKVFNLLRK